MGFFKKIFKKKKGGTFFGNLIRGASSAATGGILGSGADLAKWEQNQYQKEQVLAEKQQNALQLGRSFGKRFEPYFQGVTNSPAAERIKNDAAKDWIKKNWWMIALPVVVLLGAVYFIAKKRN